MIRALHLLDKYTDYQTATASAQLRADRNGAFDVTARTIGIHGDYSNTIGAVLWMRRHREPFDLIHAFGERALSVAAVGAHSRILFSPTRFPNRASVRWLRAINSARDVQTICATDTMRRAYVEHGVPIERCHLIRPGVDFSKIARRRDPALRKQLGFNDDDYVMLAVGESTRAAAHDQAVWAGSILHVLDPRYRLLLWGRGEMAAQAYRFAEKTKQSTLLELATTRLGRDVAFEELLPAIDLALVSARGAVSTLPIATCMAAGLPIVALVTPTVAELLEDRHTALMVGKPAPRILAQRVLDVRADTSVQWSIADMAGTEAYEYFSLTRFLEQFRAVYAAVETGKTVLIPQHPPGAGLRFHGRA